MSTHSLPAPSAGYVPGIPPGAITGPGVPGTLGRGTGAPGTTGRTFTIELPAGLAVLNLNKRLHWAKERAIARELRKAAWAIAVQQKIPHLERARIVVEYQPPPTIRRRDGENIPAPTGKHAIDGIVAAGVLDDDECPRYVEHIEHRIGPVCPRGRLVLYVTELAAVAGAA